MSCNDDGPPPAEDGDPGAGGGAQEQPTTTPEAEEPPIEQPIEDEAGEAPEKLSPAAVDKDAYRTLPHNVEAEKALLGAIFSNNRAYERVSEFLRPEHFAIPEHGLVYETAMKLMEDGKTANPITLFGLFESNDDLVALGGKAYLAELAASAVTIINTGEYGRIIYDLYMKRELIAVGNAIVARAYDHDAHDTAQMQIEAAESDFTALVSEGQGSSVAPIRDAMRLALDEIEAAKNDGGASGLGTGLIDVDLELGGMGGGDLLILGGATSMGKTAEAIGIAVHNSKKHMETGGKEGAVVMFSSLEMSDTELAKRVLSIDSGISSHDLRRGTVKNWGALVTASNKAHDLPLYIDGTPGATVQGIRQRARRLKRKQGLGLIIIDYLQLITPDKQYAGQRVNEVGQISRSLKSLAKELDVPVIALSQLSRAVDARDDHRPRKSDLRESGSLEQDADTIMFMFRPEYYTSQLKPVKQLNEDKNKYFARKADWTEQMEDEKGKAEVIIAKNRHGPAGKSIEVRFDAPTMSFKNLAYDHE